MHRGPSFDARASHARLVRSLCTGRMTRGWPQVLRDAVAAGARIGAIFKGVSHMARRTLAVEA